MTLDIILIGHRGFRQGGIIENTYEAFDKAVELGLDYIELDVHETRDGTVVVNHDGDVSRIYDGKGKIRELDFNTISELRTKEEGLEMPILGSVLQRYRGKIKFMIELKGDFTPNPAFNMVHEDSLLEDTVFSSRRLDHLQELVQIHSEIVPEICLNITHCKEFTIDDLLACKKKNDLPLNFKMISLRSTLVDQSFIDKCHELGILALCWDFKSPGDPISLAKGLIKKGIDGLLLDDPNMVDEIN